MPRKFELSHIIATVVIIVAAVTLASIWMGNSDDSDPISARCSRGATAGQRRRRGQPSSSNAAVKRSTRMSETSQSGSCSSEPERRGMTAG